MLSMTFGEKLRELRTNANMTQAELGKRLGLSEAAVRLYETGKRFPRKNAVVNKIAEIFEVSLDYLLGNDNAFLIEAVSKYGYGGKKQARDILNDVNALFAGGELSENDKDAFFKTMTEIYFKAKEENRKYRKNKGVSADKL